MLEEPRCNARACEHYQGLTTTEEDGVLVDSPYCPAFPGGIPNDIAFGDNLHLKTDSRQQIPSVVYSKIEGAVLEG